MYNEHYSQWVDIQVRLIDHFFIYVDNLSAKGQNGHMQ